MTIAFTSAQIKQGIQESMGDVRGFKPWLGESTSESQARSAIQVYSQMLTDPTGTGVGDAAYVTAQLKDRVVDLLRILDKSARAATLSDVSTQCGIDLTSDSYILSRVYVP